MERRGIVGGYFFGLFGLSTGNVENGVDKWCTSVYELLMNFSALFLRVRPVDNHPRLIHGEIADSNHQKNWLSTYPQSLVLRRFLI